MPDHNSPQRRRLSPSVATLIAAASLPALGLAAPVGAAAQHLPGPRFPPLVAQHVARPRFDGIAPHFQRTAAYPTRPAAADTPTVSLEAGQSPTGVLVLGAVIGGALAAGTGAALTAGSSDPDGGLEVIPKAAAFVLLEPIGVGVGAHVANRGRGSAVLDVLAAAGALLVGGGIVLAALSGNNRDVYRGLAFAAVPAQVAATVLVERATARGARPASQPRAAPTAPPDSSSAPGSVPGAGAVPGWW